MQPSVQLNEHAARRMADENHGSRDFGHAQERIEVSDDLLAVDFSAGDGGPAVRAGGSPVSPARRATR